MRHLTLVALALALATLAGCAASSDESADESGQANTVEMGKLRVDAVRDAFRMVAITAQEEIPFTKGDSGGFTRAMLNDVEGTVCFIGPKKAIRYAGVDRAIPKGDIYVVDTSKVVAPDDHYWTLPLVNVNTRQGAPGTAADLEFLCLAKRGSPVAPDHFRRSIHESAQLTISGLTPSMYDR